MESNKRKARIRILTDCLYQDFYIQFKKNLREMPCKDIDSVIAYTVTHTAPQWYVPQRLALSKMRSMHFCHSADNEQRFDDMYRLVCDTMNTRNVSLREATLLVLVNPAPQFFISLRRAKDIIRHELKKQTI